MKKILSLILTAAMLLSLVIIVNLPVSAVDGMWTTYGRFSSYERAKEDPDQDLPQELGYEYTDEGFKTVSCDWTGRNPYGTVQSKDPVNFEDGVYMLFSLDEYAYEGNDAWINVSFWDRQNVEAGNAESGNGVETLIRPKKDEEGKWYFSPVEWWCYNWQKAGTTNMTDEEGENKNYYVGEDGKMLFEVILGRDEDGLYKLTINGAEAPTAAVNCFVDLFVEGEAYVGISMHNATPNSNIALTILKFGTTKDDATTPQGDDYKEPVNIEYEQPAEIADPSTVPAGQPAVFMTADKENSHTSVFAAGQGDNAVANDDLTVRVLDSNGDRWNSTSFRVKSSVSYDVDDFPVMMFLTKNYCTCDDPADCYATEACNIYVMSGDMNAPASNGCSKTPEIDICWEPIVIENGETTDRYLYFWYDTASENALNFVSEGGRGDWVGRINAVQLEFSALSTDATRRTINIEWVAFFRSVEEGEAFVMSYLGLDAEEDTTEEITEDTTEAPVATTEAPTEAPTEEKTEAPTEAKTEEKTEAGKTDGGKTDGDKTDGGKTDGGKTDGGKSGGCGGVVGGAFAVIALVAACGAVILRKKED